MALQGWEAGELWAQLREHSEADKPGWCPADRKHDCSAYGYAKQRLIDAGLLEPGETPTLARQIAGLQLEWK